jgi:hypothetical protein
MEECEGSVRCKLCRSWTFRNRGGRRMKQTKEKRKEIKKMMKKRKW